MFISWTRCTSVIDPARLAECYWKLGCREAAVELLPTSHRFTRGNRIRIVVGGADKDHFKVNGAGSGVAIGGHRVVLPVER